MKILTMLVLFTLSIPSSFAAPKCDPEKNCGGGQSYCGGGTQKGKCHDASNPTLYYESASCTTCGGGAIAPRGGAIAPLGPLPKPLGK